MGRVKEGGESVHTYRTFVRGDFFKWRLEDEKMVLAGILRWDREGGYAKEGMHATFKCPHADETKQRNNWHLLIMLTKHNYANCHHLYMCTSPLNISQIYKASPN